MFDRKRFKTTITKENHMSTQANPSVTIQNLESAFAGESMAHIKYRYFAKLAREAGAEDVAQAFEATADQEVMHAFGHLDLLYPKGATDTTTGVRNRD
jgi:rubrerythrin